MEFGKRVVHYIRPGICCDNSSDNVDRTNNPYDMTCGSPETLKVGVMARVAVGGDVEFRGVLVGEIGGKLAFSNIEIDPSPASDSRFYPYIEVDPSPASDNRFYPLG